MNKGVLFLALLSMMIAACGEDEGEPACGSLSAFTGTWDMNEQCGSNDFQYPLTITENSGGGITLANLGGLGPNSVVSATVSGSSLTIPAQQVQTLTFTGNGSLNAGCTQLVLSWSGGPNGACTGTGSQ